MTIRKLKRYDAEERSESERRSDRLHWYAQVFTIACVLGVAWYAHRVSSQVSPVQLSQARVAREQAAQRRSITADRTTLIDACNRLNIVRRSVNTANLGSFVLFKTALALTALVPPTGAPQRAVTDLLLARLREAEDSLSWTPIQSCTTLVTEHGSRYQIPPPVAFTQRTPPNGALLRPARKRG